MVKQIRKKITFMSYKKIKVPTRVKFRTISGDLVSFKATKIKRIPKKITFYTRKK